MMATRHTYEFLHGCLNVYGSYDIVKSVMLENSHNVMLVSIVIVNKRH